MIQLLIKVQLQILLHKKMGVMRGLDQAGPWETVTSVYN
jgi:hypothetical protein